jgi:hypothetical protein
MFPASPDIALLGSAVLWQRPKLAFFCSAKCPGEILLRVLKWVPTLARRDDVVLASGFHTPVEALRSLQERQA